MPKTALFFDTETTGFKSATYSPRIVQLAAILQDIETKRILQEVNVMIKTEGINIPAEVVKVHGITNDLADTYGIDDLAADYIFLDMVLNADVLVAHNIKFDVEMVDLNLPHTAAVMSRKQLYCTMINSKEIVGPLPTGGHMGKKKYPKLSEAYMFFFGKPFDNAHDAMADVRACRDVYFELQKFSNTTLNTGDVY